jgi:predicted RNase H-like nuclease (RuvC/YqgF family)
MSTLTEQEAADLRQKKYVILKTNVGPYTQGEVISGEQIGPEHIRRLVWLQAIREATPTEHGFKSVTLGEAETEEQYQSFQERIARLEAENNTLRKDLLNANTQVETWKSQARPAPTHNQESVFKGFEARDKRIQHLETENGALKSQCDQLRRDNEELLGRITEMRDEYARSTQALKAELQARPAPEGGQPSRPPQSAQPEHGRKPR